MKKIEPYGKTLKERLRAGARDRLYNFVMADGALRGVIMNGTRMVNEMRSNHGLGLLETLVLGRAYLGAGLMASILKGGDRLKLQIECSGPVKGLTVDANAYGEVRGYLHKVPIPISQPVESFSLAPFLGAGILTVTRYLKSAQRPFAGKVILQYGDIAKDLAHYCLTSEQIPTAINLGIHFNQKGDVVGAGGFLLQALPAATDQLITAIEALVPAMPSLGKYFTSHGDPAELIEQCYRKYAPKFLKDRRIEFMCHCNEKRIHSLLALLPLDELDELRREGPFPVEIRCHFCNTPYQFDQALVEQIYDLRRSDN